MNKRNVVNTFCKIQTHIRGHYGCSSSSSRSCCCFDMVVGDWSCDGGLVRSYAYGGSCVEQEELFEEES